MAQGKKTDEQTLEVARAYLATGETVASVARRLSVPESTVRGWRKKFEREEGEAENRKPKKNTAEGGGGKELLQHYASDNFAELRAQKKREMIERAWRIIEKAQAKVERDLDRAIAHEAQINNAIVLLGTMGENMPVSEQKKCFKVLSQLKIEDVGKLSSLIGVMYDKQALACREETEILGGTIDVRRFEDM